MADNTELNPGTGGDIYAADDIGGIKFQRVKLVHGIDGTNDGDVASTNPFPVDVISALPTGANTIGDVTVSSLPAAAANDGVDIGDVDVTSVVPGTGATNLGKAIDSVAGATDTGVMALAIRDDALTTLTPADGDYVPLRVDSTGALHVIDGGGVAHDSPDSGNPVKIGGKASQSLPSAVSAAGDRVDAYFDMHGRMHVVAEEHDAADDVFGRVVVSAPNNDIDVQFFRGAPDVLLDVTTANSATAVSNVGGALFSSSTDANGSVQGVSKLTTVYRSGFEVYALFTAAWPTAGIASSYMRLGLYDANNGFFIGYEGTSFGVTVRNNAADTTVAKASFSEDDLTGGVASRFTRAGSPEAIDLTKLNVFRIRFGWLGSAPAYWEVMAPDGHWVTFHKTLFPNLQATPSIRSADLPITLDITKTAAAATDISIQTDCWGAGTTSAQRVLQDIYAFQTTALLNNGATFDSGVLPLSPAYSQVHTTVNASHDGDITILWYSDFGGTDLVRTLVIPYTAANGFQMFAAPAFTPYVKYQFNNDSGSNQTDFYFDTKFLTKSLSPQILRVDGPIAGGMVASVARSVIVGQTGGGSYVNVGTTNGGSLKINVEEIGENTVATNTGNASAGTQRVVLATDQPQVAVDGGTAHDAAATGSNPILLGGEARTTTPTAVADGDLVRLQCDDQGRLVTSPLAPRDLTSHNQITLTNTTETTLIAAGGAGVLYDIVTLAASNTSATKVRIDIRDSTTGTVRWSMALAADGGGFVTNFPVPLTQATANNNWTAQLSGSVTDVRVMAIAVARV